MPISAGLGALIASVVAGGAGVGGSVLAANSAKNSAEKQRQAQMAAPSKPLDFGDEMATPEQRSFTLRNANRPVVFPRKTYTG